MPARSGLSDLVVFAFALGGAPIWLASCSSPERHDATPSATVPSCEASNTCNSGEAPLPPIDDTPIIAGPCGHAGSTCTGQEGGTNDATVPVIVDAPSEAPVVLDAGVVDGSEASSPADAGPG